jgi:hypothetical protein
VVVVGGLGGGRGRDGRRETLLWVEMEMEMEMEMRKKVTLEVDCALGGFGVSACWFCPDLGICFGCLLKRTKIYIKYIYYERREARMKGG